MLRDLDTRIIFLIKYRNFKKLLQKGIFHQKNYGMILFFIQQFKI